jgi:hypothetical protein
MGFMDLLANEFVAGKVKQSRTSCRKPGEREETNTTREKAMEQTMKKFFGQGFVPAVSETQPRRSCRLRLF